MKELIEEIEGFMLTSKVKLDTGITCSYLTDEQAQYILDRLRAISESEAERKCENCENKNEGTPDIICPILDAIIRSKIEDFNMDDFCCCNFQKLVK